MNLFKYSLNDLLSRKRKTLFYIISLAFGFACFLTVQAYRTSLQTYISENKRKILGADLVVSARRHLSAEELSAIQRNLPKDSQVAINRDFFAMITAPDLNSTPESNSTPTLVMVRSVDSNFPFYGSLLNSQGLALQMNDPQKIWVSTDLVQQIQIQKGSVLKLGRLDLTVEDIVEKDESQTFRNVSFAPRVYIANSSLKNSDLLQFGSTFTESLLVQLKSGQEATLVKEKLYQLITDPGVSVEISTEDTNESSKQLGYLGDFLNLAALTSLLLAGIGASYLFGLYLNDKVKDLATLRALGVHSRQVVYITWMQGAALSAVAVLPAYLIASLSLPILNQFLRSFFQFDLVPIINPLDLVTLSSVALISGLCISLPHAFKIANLQIYPLLSMGTDGIQNSKASWLLWAPAVILFWLLSVILTRSFITSSIYLGSIVTVSAVIGVIALAIGAAFTNRTLSLDWTYRYSLKSFINRRYISLTSMITIGVASFMMNLIPQVRASLQAEIGSPTKSTLPRLFLFDIQDDQVNQISAVVKLENLSPMIRARISKVNGSPFERATNSKFATREEEQDSRFRNRAINISIRNKLSEAESVVDGKIFSGPYTNGTPEISVEHRYAKRMGLKLGDKVTFDIQGFEQETIITSLRKVRWTSFQPNFFVIVQPGVFDDVPKTWIGSVSAENLPQHATAKINKAAPNVSIINVEKTIGEALKTVDQMGQSLLFMAVLTIVTGMIILFSVIRTQLVSRRWELNMLKILGTKKKDVLKYLLFEQFLICLSGAVPGALLSIAGSWFLGAFLFESAWSVDLFSIGFSLILVLILCLLVSYLAVRAILGEKPLAILRSAG